MTCWTVRERNIGYVGVGPDGLIFDPPAPSPLIVRCGPAARVSVPPTRHIWEGWVPKVNRFPSRRARKVSNFYTVWRGWSCGIFYKWSDVYASTSGFKNAAQAFKGFSAEAEAYAAFLHGPVLS